MQVGWIMFSLHKPAALDLYSSPVNSKHPPWKWTLKWLEEREAERMSRPSEVQWCRSRWYWMNIRSWELSVCSCLTCIEHVLQIGAVAACEINPQPPEACTSIHMFIFEPRFHDGSTIIHPSVSSSVTYIITPHTSVCSQIVNQSDSDLTHTRISIHSTTGWDRMALCISIC